MFFSKYPLTTHFNNILLTDITARVDFSSLHWKNNPTLFYDYVFQDHDSLDNIADRYYNDCNLYWIILITNNILNPSFELPLKNSDFEKYLNSKYKNQNISGLQYSLQTIDPVYGYQKLITISNYYTNDIITQDYYILDEQSYNAIIPSSTVLEMNNETIIYRIEKKSPITIYERECEENENKRNIKILKKEYAQDIISVFSNLVGKVSDGY